MWQEFFSTFGTDIAAYLGAGLAGVAGYWLSRASRAYTDWKKAKSASSIPKLLSKDIGIYKYLTELLVETNSDRAYVVLFHNGHFYLNQGSHMKLSWTHEIVKDGVSRVQDTMQEMLASKFTDVLAQVLEDGATILKINPKSNSYYHQMKASHGVQTVVASVMRNKDIVEGLVVVNYLVDSLMNDADLSVEKQLTREAAERIGFQLRHRNE